MVRGSENFLQQITVLAKDGSTTVDSSGARVINADDPINPQDLATKAYVDGYDYIIKTTAADTPPNYLFNKLASGYGITITTLDMGGGDIHARFGQFSEVRNHTLSAGANNNVYPAGWQSTAVARWSSPGAASVTGIDPTLQLDDIIVKRLYNVGAFNITLNHENAGSAPDFRFLLPNGSDIILLPNTGITIYYDQTVGKWRGDALTASGGGDVFGPASSTDQALARFDGVTGKLIQNSVAVLDDLGGLNLGSDGYISIGDSTSSTGDVRLDLGGYITGIAGGGVEIYGADGDAGGAINLLGGQSNADDVSAPSITIQAGNGIGNVVEWWGTPRGGNVEISAGDSTHHMGGGVTILGGASANSTPFFDPFYGGTIRIVAGATTIGHGGDVFIDGGLTQDITETAGNVSITGGITFLAGGLAGNVSLSGGSSTNGTGGVAYINGGDGSIGGAIEIISGTSTGGGGANLSLWAGNTSGNSYDGGSVDIKSGTSYIEGSGGTITIRAGDGHGTGDGGDIIIQSGDSLNTGAHGNIEIRAYQGTLTVWGYGGTNIYSQNEDSGYINIESEHANLTVNNRAINIGFGELAHSNQFVFFDGYVSILNEGEVRWYGSDDHYSGFQASSTGSTQIWILPENDGPDGYVITTDGAGTLYWSAGGGGGSGAQTLSQTLVLGNTTGGNNIVATAGDVLIGGGTIIASTPGNIGTPGALALGIAAGSGFDDGSLTMDGDGGLIQITAGEGYGLGDGGSVDISAGSANGVDANGGDVYLTSGLGTGTGRGGHVQCYVMPSDGTGTGGEFQVYIGGDPEDIAFKINDQGDGYFYNNLEIDGKLTVGGLIDPTGLVLSEQISVPGGTPSIGNYTLWVRDDGYALLTNSAGDTSILSGGASILQNLSDVLSIGNSANSQIISDLLDPANAQDAATKNYVDGYVEVLGGDLSGSLPNPEVTDLTITGEEQGSVLYYNGANWVQLPPGEDGYALITHDTGGNPTWGMVASSAPVDSVFGRLGDIIAAVDDYSASQIDNDSTVTGEQISDALEYLDGYVDHADRHEYDGADPIDGYQIGISYVPVNYASPTNPIIGEHVAAIDDTFGIISDLFNLFINTGGDLAGSLPNPSVIDLTITAEEQGSVLYFNGSNWVQLPPGNNGYILTTHGTEADPTWEQNTSSGGGLGEVFVNLFTGNKSTNDGYWLSVGGAEINTNDFGADGYFEAVLSSENLSGAAQLRLFNITTNTQIGDILEVYDSIGYISTPVTLTSGSNIYEAQLSSPDGYWVVCYNARISFEKQILTPPISGEDGYVALAQSGDLIYIGGETDGYVLTWNAGTNIWEPQPPTGIADTPTLTEVLTEGNSAGSQNITDLLNPVDPQDAATKGYIDGYVEVLGGDLSGSLPNPEVTDLSIASEEQGSVLYFDGANWVQLPPGEDGYVLTTHSTGADPTWEESSGTGGLTPPVVGDNGYVPIANNGDLSYLGGESDGYVLTWNSGTSSWESAITNDASAIHDNVPGEISAITEKTIPAATDLLIIEDSADSNNKKRIQISSIFSIPGLSGMMNDAFIATEDQIAFTLSQTPSNDVAIMVVDGISQSSLDFTVSGTSVTYSGLALSAGQAVDFWYSLGTGSGSGGSGVQFISILSGIETHDLDGWKTVGIVEINSTEFTGTASLEAVLYTSDGYADGYARLYNTTTMTQIGSELTTTNNLPTLLSSAITLTTGSNLYELQIRVEQDGTDEFVSCGMGRIKITGSSGGGTVGETWISPDPLDADVDDWNPTGFSTATIVRVDAVDDGYSITGFDASATAIKKEVINVSAYDVVIANQDVGSVETNRIISQTGGLILAADDSMTIVYDPVTERWRVI